MAIMPSNYKNEGKKMRKNWNFDGKGVNGGDEYMSRIATLTEHGQSLNAGDLLAAAPDLLAALQQIMEMAKIDGISGTSSVWYSFGEQTAGIARAAIEKAKG